MAPAPGERSPRSCPHEQTAQGPEAAGLREANPAEPCWGGQQGSAPAPGAEVPAATGSCVPADPGRERHDGSSGCSGLFVPFSQGAALSCALGGWRSAGGFGGGRLFLFPGAFFLPTHLAVFCRQSLWRRHVRVSGPGASRCSLPPQQAAPARQAASSPGETEAREGLQAAFPKAQRSWRQLGKRRASPSGVWMGPSSFQWCPVTGQGVMGTN